MKRPRPDIQRFASHRLTQAASLSPGIALNTRPKLKATIHVAFFHWSMTLALRLKLVCRLAGHSQWSARMNRRSQIEPKKENGSRIDTRIADTPPVVANTKRWKYKQNIANGANELAVGGYQANRFSRRQEVSSYRFLLSLRAAGQTIRIGNQPFTCYDRRSSYKSYNANSVSLIFPPCFVNADSTSVPVIIDVPGSWSRSTIS